MTSLADFPHFALTDEHEDLRKTVRELCEAKIAPGAAEADEKAEVAQAAYDALPTPRPGDVLYVVVG